MVSFSSTAFTVLGAATLVSAGGHDQHDVITLGTRPYYLVDEMKGSALKDKLGEFVDSCLEPKSYHPSLVVVS